MKLNDLTSMREHFDVVDISPDYFTAHYREFLPRYISFGRPSADTLRTYGQGIDQFIAWCRDMGRHPLAMQEYQLRLYLQYLYDLGYKDDTIGNKMAAVKIFFFVAKKMRFIKENPVEEIKAPSAASRDEFVKFFTTEQLRAIHDVFADEYDELATLRNSVILYLMSVEGLRRIEVQRMNVEDVDLNIGSLLVRGKTRDETIIPCQATLDAIKSYLLVHPPKQLGDRVTPLIVSLSPNNMGRRISRVGLNFIMDKALKKVELKYPGASCHVLRHSCGTNLYRETKDILVVQKVLRQRSPQTTAKYAHVNDQIMNRVTGQIAF